MRNKILQDLLKEKGLSVFKASKILKINPLIIKEYKDGYLQIDDKKAIEISQKLDVDPMIFLNDTLNYPEHIELEDNKNKILNIANKIFGSLIAWISGFLIFIISLISLIISSININMIDSNPLKTYGTDAETVFNKVIENGELGLTPPFLALYSPMSFCCSFSASDTSSIEIRVPLDDKQPELLNFTYKTNDAHNLLILPYGKEGGVFGLYNFLKDERRYQCTINMDYNFFIKEITVVDLNSYKEVEPISNIYKEAINNTNKNLAVLLSNLDTIFTQFFEISGGFAGFFKNFTIQTSKIYVDRDFYYLFLVISFIIEFISFFALAFSSILRILKIKKNKKTNNQNKENGLSLTCKNEKYNLTKNIKYGPNLKCGYIRLIALILLFLGNASIMLLFLSLENNEIYEYINSIEYKEILTIFRFISIFILTYILIDLIRTNQYTIFRVIAFLIGGIGYYFLELITIKYLENTGFVFDFLTNYFPINFLWSTGIYAFIDYFLFANPKFITNKRKEIIFRTLSILPLVALISSEIITYLNESGTIIVNKYYNGLLIHKSYGLSMFLILFMFILFFYEKYQTKKYGKDNFLILKNGNKYAWTRNLIGAFSLIVAYSIVFSFKNIMPSFTNDFNNIKFVIILIPIILLYRERIPKPNLLENVAYLTGFFVAMVLPYLISFFIIFK